MLFKMTLLISVKKNIFAIFVKTALSGSSFGPVILSNNPYLLNLAFDVSNAVVNKRRCQLFYFIFIFLLPFRCIIRVNSRSEN